MAKHRLIISPKMNPFYPVRSEAEALQQTRTLVVNWKGKWGPEDRPEQCLIVAPGDELEFALESEQSPGGGVWVSNPRKTLLLPDNTLPRKDDWEHVDVERGSKVLRVNPALARESAERRYGLRTSALGLRPLPIVMQGQVGNLTATRP